MAARPQANDRLRKALIRHVAACALLALVAGCASSATLNDVWLSDTYSGPPLTKIIVLGIAPDGASKRVFEDSFSASLRKSGVQAYPAYSLLPGDTTPTADQLRQAVQRSGAEAILVTRVEGVEQKTETTPGYVRSTPGWGYRGGFYGYYGRYPRAMVVYAGTTRTYNVVKLQTNLWALQGDGNLIWSATSQSVSPDSVAQLGTDLAGVIAEELAEGGLIPPPSGAS